MADGRLDPLPLVTHRFPIGNAASAYELIAKEDTSLGIVLSYTPKAPVVAQSARNVVLSKPLPHAGKGSVGFIGAGNFAARVLIPAFKSGGASLDLICSRGGVSAATVGERHGFRRVTSDADIVLADPNVDVIVVATGHDSHAELVTRALQAGKHVFVEKPLALTTDEVRRVGAALESAPGVLCVGFNRRFAPYVQLAKRALTTRSGPLVVSVTVNAGAVPREHWTQNPSTGGGRIVGEACHFIDLCRFLAGSPIAELQVLSARASGGEVMDDVSLLQLSFADGSLATVQYFANGNKAFPKERVELSFDGRTMRIDNFRTVSAWGISRVRPRWPSRRSKGHQEIVAAFLNSVRAGSSPPIPANELLEVSHFSVHAARLARDGGGAFAREI
jgi:predicted dehydrogenase